MPAKTDILLEEEQLLANLQHSGVNISFQMSGKVFENSDITTIKFS
jgi:hypothetical protein